MFPQPALNLNNRTGGGEWADDNQSALQLAVHLFNRAMANGMLNKALSFILHRPSRLLDLGEIQKGASLRSSHSQGIRAVPIAQIRGSQGRVQDFDADFNPLSHLTRHRWQSVASAQLNGVPLPAVELIQVGEYYFVKDGHHRISVAKALGQSHIDAEVTLVNFSGPLPWERKDRRTKPASARIAPSACSV